MKFISSLVLVFLLTSCATLFSPSEDTITFKSEPSGATVRLNGNEIGKTPLEYTLDRDTFTHHNVTFSAPGYTSKTMKIQKTLATAAIFNFFSITSWGTDALTGNAFRYNPTSYYIELEGKSAKVENTAKPLRRFVMSNYMLIMTDLAKGQGEYLTSYAKLSGKSEKELISKLRPKMAELAKHNDGVDFYRHTERLL